jgi:hypothetical protein
MLFGKMRGYYQEEECFKQNFTRVVVRSPGDDDFRR